MPIVTGQNLLLSGSDGLLRRSGLANLALGALMAGLGLSACGSDSSSAGGSGGQGFGGRGAGGLMASGGATAMGGRSGSAGASATGGSTGGGGRMDTGGAAGGGVASGGVAGTSGAGGATGGPAGGTTASGGVAGTGAAGGTAGGAGGAGAAGSRVPPSVRCPPRLLEAKAPIMLEAMLGCESLYGLSIAPTSVADTVYVAIPVYEQDMYIAKVAPSGISIEAGGFDADSPMLFLGDHDAPKIVAGSRSDIGLALWTPGTPNWSYETISPGILGPYGYNTPPPRSVLLASNGEPRVLYGWLELGERSPAGTWSDTNITPDLAGGADMVMDSLGRTRIVYRHYSQSKIEEWIDGRLLDGYPAGGSNNNSIAIAVNPSNVLGVVRMRPDAIAMTFSDGTSVSNDLVIASVTPFMPDDCGHTSAFTCESQGVLQVGLAATDDGSFWLAYAFRHKDYDIETYQDATGHVQTRISADRSMDEIRLLRVSPNGSQAPSTRWNQSVPYDATHGLRLVARGSRLYLGIAEAVTHVFAFDWRQL